MTRSALAARGCAAALGLVALYALAVGTAAGRRLDADAFDRVSGDRLDPVADAITRALNPLTFAVAAGAVMVVAYRRSPRTAVIVVAMLLASNVSAWVLEWVLGSVDPLGGETRRVLGAAYFPSGHATAATSLAFAAVLVAPPRRRKVVAVACVCFVTIFGTAVVASGSHTPSDVLGAVLLCGAWAAVAARAVASGGAPRRLTARTP